MNLRLEEPVSINGPVRIITAATLLLAAVGTVLLLRFALTGDPAGHLSLTIENATDQVLTVEVVDRSGSVLNLGGIEPKTTTTRHEVVDIGPTWTFVVRLAGREIHRTPAISRDQLQAQAWRVRIPPELTTANPAVPRG